MSTLNFHVSSNNAGEVSRIARYAATRKQKDIALALAVQNNLPDMVEVLLNTGAYANAISLDFGLEFEGNEYQKYSCAKEMDDDMGMGFRPKFQRVIHVAYYYKREKMIKSLIKAGAELSSDYRMEPNNGTGGESIVNYAAVYDNNMLRLFVESGVDLNRHRNYYTPLGSAMAHPRLHVIGVGPPDTPNMLVLNYLYDNGAHVDTQPNKYGTSHIHLAATYRYGRRDHPEAYVDWLLRRMVDVNVLSGGESVIRGIFDEYVSFISNDAVFEASKRDKLKEFLRQIFEYNVDFSFIDRIHAAVSPTFPDEDYAKVIGGDVYAMYQEYRHMASRTFLESLTRENVPITSRNHVDAQDTWRKTALHRAAENAKYHDVVYLLREKHANQNLRDYWGRTACESVKKRYEDYLEKMHDPSKFCAPGKSYGDTPPILMQSRLDELKMTLDILCQDARNVHFWRPRLQTITGPRLPLMLPKSARRQIEDTLLGERPPPPALRN
jgi:hypothetical protein